MADSSLFDRLQAIADRYSNLEEQMSDPENVQDQEKFARLNRSYKELSPIMDAFRQYKQVLDDIRSAEEHLQDKDPEMRQMAQMEMEAAREKESGLEEKIKYLLIPKDPEDSKNVLFEIRAGTGGDEASIFAGDLYRMYTRFFEKQGWKTEIITSSEGSAGGYDKIFIEVQGENVYGRMKFESGAHRVQRVPKTESQGRVHTSAATVAVIPKMEIEDLDINKADIKVDTFRSSGAGGQHVNKTESGVRFTHIPTGVVAESTDGRSQIQNREIAMNRLVQKIQEAHRSKQEHEMASKRKSLVGSGDRSDKIRTYNFPQNRVTDHRINLTLYNLDQVMEGDLEEIIETLQLAENTEKLRTGETVA